MEFEIKNKKLTDDEFYKIREEILSTWETGKDAMDLQAGIDYQKSIPEHKSFSKKLLKAKEEGVTLIQPRAGVSRAQQRADQVIDAEHTQLGSYLVGAQTHK